MQEWEENFIHTHKILMIDILNDIRILKNAILKSEIKWE